MNTKSFLIPAAALLAGCAVGWFAGESPRPVAAPAAAPPQAAQTPAGKAAGPAAKLPEKKPFAALYEHLVWLESATAAEVALGIWAPSLHDESGRALAMVRFMRFTARERLDALLAIEKGTSRSRMGDEAGWLTPTVAEMIASAPEEVAQLLRKAGVPFETSGILDNLFASQGYDGCIGFLSKLPEDAQMRLRGAAATLLAKQDLARAQVESLKLPEGPARNEMVAAVSQVWSESDPRVALAWALQHGREQDDSTGGGSKHPGRSLLAALLLKDPKLGGELLLENQSAFDGSYGPYILGQTFEAWAQRDYQAATDWLAANPLGDELQASASQALASTRLQSLKGAEALQFYETVPGHLKGDCAEALVNAVGLEGLPGGLAAFSESLPEDERLDFLSSIRNGRTPLTTEQIKSILPMLAKLDTNGYVLGEYLNKLPEADLAAFQPLLPEKMQAEIGIWAAEKALDAGDLETAKTLLSKAVASNNTLPHAQLAIELAQDNPEDATAWIDTLSDGQAKQDAITNLAADWAKTDLAAASAWVEKLPPGKARDRAVTKIALLQSLSGETSAAVALAASVQSEPARLEAFANAARSAWFQNAAAAEALLAARGLSAEQTQKVIAKIQSGKAR